MVSYNANNSRKYFRKDEKEVQITRYFVIILLSACFIVHEWMPKLDICLFRSHYIAASVTIHSWSVVTREGGCRV
jgi:hypothetical protein